MSKLQFIGTENLQEIANKYTNDVIMSAAYFRPDVFDRLGIQVLSGIEFQDTVNVMHRKGRTARRKVSGDHLASSAGYIEERKLITELVWDRIPDNIDNYREVAVFDTLGSNQTYTYPKCEKFFRETVAITFGEDCFDCLFHGDSSIDREGPNGAMGLFNGIVTNLRRDITNNLIKAELRNIVAIPSIDEITSTSDSAPWVTFKQFINAWHPSLRNQKRVNVLLTPTTCDRICGGYSNAHNSNTSAIYHDDGSVSFMEYPNIFLTPEASFGSGDLMIATIPNNMQYGVDSLNSQSSVSVKVGSDNDNKDVFYQIEAIMGTRIVDVNASKFCMSSGALLPVSYAGDYSKDSLDVLSNNADLGTVTKTPDQADYTAGTAVELKAIPTDTGAFLRWSDGNTNATRQYVTKGYPDAVTAIFGPKA